MRKGYVIQALCTLSLLLVPVSALAQPVPGCARATDVDTLVDTAERILMVNAVDYQEVINFWAEDATYKEAVVTNDSREEMYAYLDNIFAWSSDMERTVLRRGIEFGIYLTEWVWIIQNINCIK